MVTHRPIVRSQMCYHKLKTLTHIQCESYLSREDPNSDPAGRGSTQGVEALKEDKAIVWAQRCYGGLDSRKSYLSIGKGVCVYKHEHV